MRKQSFYFYAANIDITFKHPKECNPIAHENCALLCFIASYFAVIIPGIVPNSLLNLIPMNPLRSTSRNNSISSDATVANVSRFIVMPEGMWNLSRMRRIISWFRVCQTIVRRIGSQLFIFFPFCFFFVESFEIFTNLIMLSFFKFRNQSAR